MPLIIPPGGYLAKLRWRLTGDNEECISTLGVMPLDDNARSPNQIAEAVFKAWSGAWEPSTLAREWAFVGVDVIGAGPPDEKPVGTYNELVVGTNTSAPLPQNCCILLKKKTESAGQRNQGRMFLPSGYGGEAAISPTGALLPSDLTLMQANADQFRENLVDIDADPPGSPAPGNMLPALFHSVGTALSTVITSFVVDAIIATQRQRLRR